MTSIELSVAAVTVSVVSPDIPPKDAVMVAEPAATDVASPSEPSALLMVAMVLSDEPHVTDVVRS